MRGLMCVGLALLGAASEAQTVITDANYESYFKQMAKKEAYLIYPGDGRNDKPKYLGKISTSTFDKDSLSNTYGKYGNTFDLDSIFNKYGIFGGLYGSKSPWREFGNTRIEIQYKEGNGDVFIAGVLTSNKGFAEFRVPRVDPRFLATFLKRISDIP